MLQHWRDRRRLGREITKLDKELLPQVERAKLEYKHAAPGEDFSVLIESRYKTERYHLEMELEVLEAKRLIEKGEKWGTDGSPTKLIYDPNIRGIEPRPYFNPQNKVLMRRWIAEARFNGIKKWVDLLSPVVATIISIIALILSIYALHQTH
jgi:hypothetical protein